MIITRFSKSSVPVQVDFVPKDKKEKPVKRSVKGSVHFTPGAIRLITESEYAYIEKYRKDVFVQLSVVAKIEEPKEEKLVEKVVEEPKEEKPVVKVAKRERRNK